MGDRSYIVIESKDFDSDIVIYSHWGGINNVTVVANVLTFTKNIGDPSYFAAEVVRMAFEENHYHGDTGMGISTLAKGTFTEQWADNPTVYVNADTGRWKIGDTELDRWAKPWDGEEN